jgi:hypothetical protein
MRSPRFRHPRRTIRTELLKFQFPRIGPLHDDAVSFCKGIAARRSLGLDVCGSDHLAPFLGIFDDKLAELLSGPCDWQVAEFQNPRPEVRISEACVVVELSRCSTSEGVFRCAKVRINIVGHTT